LETGEWKCKGSASNGVRGFCRCEGCWDGAFESLGEYKRCDREFLGLEWELNVSGCGGCCFGGVAGVEGTGAGGGGRSGRRFIKLNIERKVGIWDIFQGIG